MNLIRKVGILFFLSIIGLSVIFSNTVKAISPYDNLIDPVNNVSTTCIYTGGPSSKINWTNNWYNFIKNYDATGNSNLQAAKSLLMSNVAAGKGYGVFSWW